MLHILMQAQVFLLVMEDLVEDNHTVPVQQQVLVLQDRVMPVVVVDNLKVEYLVVAVEEPQLQEETVQLAMQVMVEQVY